MLGAFAKVSKVHRESRGPMGGVDLRFTSPQPDTSLHCETTYTGLVHRVVCLFTSQPSGQYQLLCCSATEAHRCK